MLQIPMDDISSISNDIELATEIMDDNFDGGELSDCGKYLNVEASAVREVQKFLTSAVQQLSEILNENNYSIEETHAGLSADWGKE